MKCKNLEIGQVVLVRAYGKKSELIIDRQAELIVSVKYCQMAQFKIFFCDHRHFWHCWKMDWHLRFMVALRMGSFTDTWKAFPLHTFKCLSQNWAIKSQRKLRSGIVSIGFPAIRAHVCLKHYGNGSIIFPPDITFRKFNQSSRSTLIWKIFVKIWKNSKPLCRVSMLLLFFAIMTFFVQISFITQKLVNTICQAMAF